MTKKQKQEQEEAREELRGMLKPGDEVSLILRHVSRSGMLRVIAPLVPYDNGSGVTRLRPIGHLVARAIGAKYDRDRYGVKVGGCGMDMGFHVVYSLAAVLFGDGYALTSRWL